jgi:Zn-dependent protease
MISSKLAGAPMSYLLVTATRQVTIYEGDQSQFPPRVHITRAIGGPIANIAAGVIGLLLTTIIGATPALLYFTIVNLLAVFALLPIPTVDGEVIWKYARKVP